MPDPLTPADIVIVVVVSGIAALLVHELGHLLAAGALGGSNLRLRFGWPALRVEATLPEQPGFLVVFLAAGAIANLGAAAALWGFAGVFRIAALVQLAMAAAALLPVGTSDGARLLACFRGHRDAV